MGGGEIFLAYLALNLLTLALFAPLLPTAIRQVTGWPRTGAPVELLSGLSTVARWLIYGSTSTPPGWAYLWPVLFIGAAFLPDWLRRRDRLTFGWRLALPWLWLAIFVVPLFTLGLYRDANLKLLIPAQIAVALLIGRGAWLLWELGTPNIFIIQEAAPRLIASVGLVSMAMFSQDALDNLYRVSGYARDDYRGMARLISAEPRAGDAIVLDGPGQSEVFTYYYHGNAPIYPLPAGLGGDDAATRAAIQGVIHANQRIFVLYWGEHERDPQGVVEAELNAATFPAWSRWYGNVRLVAYAVPRAPAAAPSQVLDADFGGLIRLHGVALDAANAQPGDVIGITLFWQAETPISKRYKVFIHLLNADGQIAAQRDSEPQNGTSFTTSWAPGSAITDAHGLLLPTSLSAGTYRLIAGLYDSDTPTARLPVNGTDHVDLGTITVK